MTGGITGQGQATYANTIANLKANNGVPSGGVFTPRTYPTVSSTPHAASSPESGVATSAGGGAAMATPSATGSPASVSQSSTTAFSAGTAAKAGFGIRSLSTEPGGIYLISGGNYYNEYGNLIGNSHTGIVTSNPQGISAIQNALSTEPAGYGITVGGSVINAQGIPVGNTLTNTPYKGSGISEASLTPPIDFAAFGNNAQIQWSATNPYNFTLEEPIPGYAQKFQFTGTIGGGGIGAGTIYATDSAVEQAWGALTGGAPLWGSQGVINRYSTQQGLQSQPISFNLQTGAISSSGSIIGEIGTYGVTNTPLYGNIEATNLNYNYNLGNVISGNAQPQTYVTNTPAMTQSQAQSLLNNAALFSSYQPGNYIYSGPRGYNQVQVSGSAGYATLQALSGSGNTITGYTATPFTPGNYVVSTNPSATPQYVSLEAFATAAPGTTFSQTTTSTVSTQSTSSGTLPYSLTALGVFGAISGGTYNALTSWMSPAPSNTVPAGPTGINFQGATQIPLSASAISSINKAYNLGDTIDVLPSYENNLPRQSSYIIPEPSTSFAAQSGLPIPIKPSNTLTASEWTTTLAGAVVAKNSIFDFLDYPLQLIKYTQSQVANPQSPYSVLQGAVNQANAAPIKTPLQWVLKETGVTSAPQDVLVELAFWSPAASAAANAVPVLGGQARGLIPNAQVINSPTASPEAKVFAFAGMLGTGSYDALSAYYVTLGIGGLIDWATGVTVAGTTAGTSATVGAATRAAIGAASGSSEAYATNLAAYATEQSAANAAYGGLSLAAKVGKGAISISNFVNTYALAGYAISYGQAAAGTYVPTYTSNVGQDIFIKQTIGGLENAAFATTVTLGAAGLSAGWSALNPEPVSAVNEGVLQGGKKCSTSDPH